ncbi:hypothetical protein HPB47_011715 [Ixodes persulcatus]|uniref:Uncharacterized protein n=1 Tax=Ixodes persulcatus TaxID=34615 RepID=A0AC60NVJ8_IXOPE|nr:hypothetical protein HPB47_011715 [Ixodes persulcatus]
MAKPTAKYTTIHKFGKRRKKSFLNNLKKLSAEPERTEDLQLSRSDGAVEAAETAELAGTKVGLGGPSASERSSDSGCNRRDTAMLQSSNVEGMRKKADQKLQDLASTAATKRKSVLLADMKDNADGSLAQTDEASFTELTIECAQSVRGLYRELNLGNPGNIAVSYDGLFERSWQRHNLRYTTVLSDGDNHTFLALQEAQVYGYIAVNKEDCANHVQKRMGTALRTLITKQKSSSENLGGKGRLTADLITKLSAYCGWALKSHKGDVEAILCPAGPDSWCRQNATKARGEPGLKHHYNLSPHVCKALLPLYKLLSKRKLLERCQRGKTQNTNETVHSMIWALAPKHRHASLLSVEAAVAEALLKFNAGNEIASARILRELNVTPGKQSSKRMVDKDKRSSADNVQRALKKRHSGASNQADYIPGVL